VAPTSGLTCAFFRRAAVWSPESLFEQAVTILAGASPEQHDRFAVATITIGVAGLLRYSVG
jgi:hypothetical protein